MEKAAHKVGIVSFIISLILIIAMSAFGAFETLNTIDWVAIIVINILMLIFFIAGIFLWVKGWHRYKYKLKNPWALVWYVGCLTFTGSYFLFSRDYSSENKGT